MMEPGSTVSEKPGIQHIGAEEGKLLLVHRSLFTVPDADPDLWEPGIASFLPASRNLLSLLHILRC
jgi:hypothetical protein